MATVDVASLSKHSLQYNPTEKVIRSPNNVLG